VKNTNLQTEFLLQIWKQQEDSAILLASNRPQHKDKTKNRPTEKEKQNFKGKDSKEQTKNKILQRACILLTVCQLYDRQNMTSNCITNCKGKITSFGLTNLRLAAWLQMYQ
jgi:hypothetical protein